jgi:hypothetical protein
MKTKIFIAVVIASLTLMVSATVWEGVTDVVSKGDLPGNYSVATNSFPKNSVVDITNLENGKTVRALVVSGLETTGLLATLSRNAALSLELRGNSTCRIRITQPSDDIAFSRFKLGPVAAVPPSAAEKEILTENKAPAGTDDNIAAVESDSITDSAAAITPDRADDPLAAETVNGTDADAVVAEAAKPAEPSVKPAVKPVEEIAETDNRTRTTQAPAKAVKETAVMPAAMPSAIPASRETAGTVPEAPMAEAAPENAAVQSPIRKTTERYTNTGMEPVKSVPAAVVQPSAQPSVDNPPESRNAGNLSIVPSEERPPNAANSLVTAPENRAPPLKKDNSLSSALPSNASPSGKSDFSPFQVPLINRLEQGKCYVQVAAYQRVEHVEDEISRIGTTYPLAVQNVGSDASPMFRILLGPLNQGESGALLQRVKSIGYNDAFIRYN